MRFISLVLISFLISACAPQPIFVNLPTPIKPPIPFIPEKVVLPLTKLTINSSPSEVMTAYVNTVRRLIIDDLDLRDRLASYQK